MTHATGGWIKGTDGQVRFDGENLSIRHSGPMGWGKGGRGEITLHISQISGIEIKSPGLTAGRFTVMTAGTVMAKGNHLNKAHRTDPMTVLFQRWAWDAFSGVAAAVQQAITQNRTRAPHQVQHQIQDGVPGLAGQLQELATLHAQGALSDAEYEQAKAKVLGPSVGYVPGQR